jgi:hypothetical protein
MLKSLVSRLHRKDQASSARKFSIADLVDCFYLLFFERPADQAAIEHWSRYLNEGLSPVDFFRILWRSDEFSTKGQQNPYIRPPGTPHENEQAKASLITPAYFEELILLLKENKSRLLEVGLVRAAVAQWRYRDLMQASQLKMADSAEFSVPDTIPYSELTLRSYVADDRPMHMIRPLVTIGRIAENVADLKVLSIGARTETELFAILSGGFSLPNITMIDLFSYSPFIQIGDMHKMGFASDAFDVIIFGDTLAYSLNPALAVSEIIRVAKDRTVISIGHACTRSDTASQQTSAHSQFPKTRASITVQSTDDILRWFDGHVGKIYARYEPEPVRTPQLNRVLTVFEIVK